MESAISSTTLRQAAPLELFRTWFGQLAGQSIFARYYETKISSPRALIGTFLLIRRFSKVFCLSIGQFCMFRCYIVVL